MIEKLRAIQLDLNDLYYEGDDRIIKRILESLDELVYVLIKEEERKSYYA